LAKRARRNDTNRKITISKFNERCRCDRAMVLRVQNAFARTFACARCGEVRVITR